MINDTTPDGAPSVSGQPARAPKRRSTKAPAPAGQPAEVTSPEYDGSRPSAPEHDAREEAASAGHERAGLMAKLMAFSDSAAGYDEDLLLRHGSASDCARRRNIGRAIIVATLVGSLGWAFKVSTAIDGVAGLILAFVIAALYGVFSYSLESFFSSNVDPLARPGSKLIAFVARSLLSAVIAFSSAMPWVTVALQGPIKVEAAKLELQERKQLRDGVAQALGTGAMEKRTSELAAELSRWSDAAGTPPPNVVAAQEQSHSCDAALETLVTASEKRVSTLNQRLATLAALESARGATAATVKAVAVERSQINKLLSKLSADLSDKRTECAGAASLAASQMREYSERVGAARSAAEERLAAHRQAEDQVTTKALSEQSRVDAVVSEAAAGHGSAEFAALIAILKRDFYAQFMAGLIFLGLFLVDVLPLTLRLIAAPGPYDHWKALEEVSAAGEADDGMLRLRLVRSARASVLNDERFAEEVAAAMTPIVQREVITQAANSVLRYGRGPGALTPLAAV